MTFKTLAPYVKKNSGFTILECLVGGIIVALIVGAIFSVLSLYQHFAIENERRAMAVGYARETMERLAWDPAIVATGLVEEPITEARPLKGAPNVRRTRQVTLAPNGQYFIIDVRVRWD